MQRIQKRLQRSGISLGLLITFFLIIGMALVVNLVKGVNFFSLNNILNVIRNYSLIAIAAMGQTLYWQLHLTRKKKNNIYCIPVERGRYI